MFTVFALAALAAAAGGSDWRLAGTTYNSAAFVDLASVAGAGPAKRFTAMRVSGQPAKDGWRTVVQKLTVNCDTRMFVDAGSRIEQADGSVKTYPGFGATQRAVSTGVFFDMYEIVCGGRSGKRVGDPEAWTKANFKVG
jgi:hypothetical protein